MQEKTHTKNPKTKTEKHPWSLHLKSLHTLYFEIHRFSPHVQTHFSVKYGLLWLNQPQTVLRQLPELIVDREK